MSKLLKPVPHLHEKMMRFYSLGAIGGGSKDRGSFIKALAAKSIKSVGSSTLDLIIPPNNTNNGTEAQHQAIVEHFLGPNSWPFPEYFDNLGRNEDADLQKFHEALDKRFKLIRFQPKGLDTTDRNFVFDKTYFKCGLDYQDRQNSVCVRYNGSHLDVRGSAELGFEQQQIATIRIERFSIQVSSEGDSRSFLKHAIGDDVGVRGDRYDFGFDFEVTVSPETPANSPIKGRTSYIAYDIPDGETDELIVEVRSFAPKVEFDRKIIESDEDRLQANRIIDAFLDNTMNRSATSSANRIVDRNFPVYRMSYKAYEDT